MSAADPWEGEGKETALKWILIALKQTYPDLEEKEQIYYTWQMELTACLWALDFSVLLPNFIFDKNRFLPLRVSTYLEHVYIDVNYVIQETKTKAHK